MKYDFSKPVKADVKLYAKWRANIYTITFDANGGKGTMAPQTFTYDAEQKLTANAFTFANKFFIGWKDANGTVFADQQTLLNLTAKDGASFTLYAQWADKPAQVIIFDTSDLRASSRDGKLNPPRTA